MARWLKARDYRSQGRGGAREVTWKTVWKTHSKSEVFTHKVVSEYPVAGQKVR